MVQRLKINQFYGAPTAVRLLLKYGDSWVKKYDRSSLRTLGSGEWPAMLQERVRAMWQSQCRLVDGFDRDSCVAVSVVNSNSARLHRKQMSLPVRSFLEAPADNSLGHNILDVSVPEFCASSLL